MAKMNRVVSRQELMKSRAQAYFAVYYGMGANRSLAKLGIELRRVGVRTSDQTLENYSSRFHWADNVSRLDAEAKEQQEAELVNRVKTMNERQAQAGRNLQALASAGIVFLNDKVTRDRKLELTPSEITGLMREGANLERLALGEVTEQTEAVIHIWNIMAVRIGYIFEQVNPIPDPEQRKRKFVQMVDTYKDKELSVLLSGAES